MSSKPSLLYPKLRALATSLNEKEIPQPRKEILQPMIDFLQVKKNRGEQINLNFICTHNSRRSHLSQVWAQALAHHFGISHVACYSGGTEATAVFPMIVQTLAEEGFDVHKLSEETNPIYSFKYTENSHPVIAFSKVWSHHFNPQDDFAAIMTCGSADEACPTIAGASKRFAITYEDPKAFDGTPMMTQKYRERSLQIASEWSYIFSQLA